jgi:MFS family permease
MNGDDANKDDGLYRYVVVAMLALAYMLNFVDRQLLSILVEPIKAELALSDTQMGLLTGLMFALFYTLFGIPVAMIADRKNRIRLVAIACATWSLFTALSGFARGFAGLAIARVGVGIGEAGCSPPSYSILSDYFPPEQRGRALALYVLGIPAGTFVGTLAGGSIAAEYGWRAAFFALGAAGLLFTPLLLIIVREPPRGRYDPEREVATTAGLNEALAFFWRSKLFLLTALSCGLTAFCGYGLLAWAPAYLIRVHGMTLDQMGGSFAVASAGAMVLAAWIGAWISDRAGARDPVNYATLPGLAVLASAPFLVVFPLAGTWALSLALLVPAMIFTAIYFVPALALLQNRTPPNYRATVSSVLLFLINLIGLGCGPLFVGALSDHLTPSYGVGALGMALQWLAPFAVLAFVCQRAAASAIRSGGMRRQE